MCKMNLGCCVEYATLKGHCPPGKDFTACYCCRWRLQLSPLLLLNSLWGFFLWLLKGILSAAVEGGELLISVPHLHFPCLLQGFEPYHPLVSRPLWHCISVSPPPSVPGSLQHDTESQHRETDQPCVPIYNNKSSGGSSRQTENSKVSFRCHWPGLPY